jgi:hypothetical protein
MNSQHNTEERAAQAARLHIVPRGLRGFEVQPPDQPYRKAVPFNTFADRERNWAAAVKFARRQPWAQPRRVEFQKAVLIGWGYDTSGDFDEALRVYTEQERMEGNQLIVPTGDALRQIKAEFNAEFASFAEMFSEAQYA